MSVVCLCLCYCSVLLCLLRFGLKSLCAKVLVPGMAPDIVWARLEEVLPLCPVVKRLFYCVLSP